MADTQRTVGNGDDGRVADLEAALVEMLSWAEDACEQGTGNRFQGSPGWHNFMSTWEEADVLLPRTAELLVGAASDGSSRMLSDLLRLRDTVDMLLHVDVDDLNHDDLMGAQILFERTAKYDKRPDRVPSDGPAPDDGPTA